MKTEQYEKSAVTEWYTREQKPTRIGVYCTSTEKIKDSGNCYGYWNGASWEAYKGWGDYSDKKDFIWCGLTKQRKYSIANHALLVSA